jgi:hypothetical protein
MDNARNNDTCMTVLQRFYPYINIDDSRLRCLGHIINLVVKALLFEESNIQLQEELDAAGDKECFAIWRKTGSIGKLHDIVRFISRLRQRQRAFAAV